MVMDIFDLSSSLNKHYLISLVKTLRCENNIWIDFFLVKHMDRLNIKTIREKKLTYG